MNSVKLNNGVEMPIVGIGTYCIEPKDAEVTVREGLKMGYRMVDTANAYVNERAVATGIRDSGVVREEVFVSSKIWATEYLNPNAVVNTLERLEIEYIDLLFIHQPTKNYMEGYRMIEKAYKEGKVKAIGISNCEGEYLKNILENCEIKPQVIQVEAHPYFIQEDLREELQKENIVLMSWYPLGHGDSKLINEETFKKIGKKYGKTSAQVILRWHLDMGFVIIPGSSNIEHIKDNFNILDFKLSNEEMKEVAKLNKNERYYYRTDEMLKQFSEMELTYEEQ